MRARIQAPRDTLAGTGRGSPNDYLPFPKAGRTPWASACCRASCTALALPYTELYDSLGAGRPWDASMGSRHHTTPVYSALEGWLHTVLSHPRLPRGPALNKQVAMLFCALNSSSLVQALAQHLWHPRDGWALWVAPQVANFHPWT